MSYIRFEEEWPWGKTITFTEKDGLGAIDVSVTNGNGYAYISDLKVHPICRKQKRGTLLLKQAEHEIVNYLGLHYALLRVVPDSWVREWYERNGYTLFTHEEEGFVELIKYLQ